MLEKINSYLYFAFASRNIVLGESSLYALAKNKVHLLVLASDIGSASKKKMMDKASFYKVPLIFYSSKKDLGPLFRKGEVAIVGILDKGLATAIINSVKEEN